MVVRRTPKKIKMSSAQAFQIMLNSHPDAESVTCNGNTFRALVNRLPSGRELGSAIQVSSLKQSIIQVLPSVEIEENDVITDTKGVNHTVFEYRHLGHCKQVICTQT